MRAIDNLVENGDQLVRKFRPDELQGVWTDNRYHSPEISETDEEDSNKGKSSFVTLVGDHRL